MRALVKKLVLIGLLGGAIHPLMAQITSDILGVHNLQAGGPSPVQGNLSPCLFCHAPHGSKTGARGLWSQQLSTVSNYTLPSGTLNQPQQPVLGSVSNQCLSCHDGTVAIGQTTPYGQLTLAGTMNASDVFGTDLSSVHPFNFTLPLDPNTPNLVPTVISGTGTANPAVKLINGNVQCTSCHDPHNQFIDQTTQMFLVVDNTASGLCLACHSTNPAAPIASNPGLKAMFKYVVARSGTPKETGTALRSSLFNSAATWKYSSHARASHKTSLGNPGGRYGSVGRNGCMSCHAAHDGAKGASLLRQPSGTELANLDTSTKNCVSCHNGSDAVSPALPNILAEMTKGGHPVPAGKNTHQTREKALLDGNRHATCVDCHNPHGAQQTDNFDRTALRKAQSGATGVSAVDGTTVLQPAQTQYETCLRCHGVSTGKQTLSQFGYFPNFVVSSGDPLDVLAQFNRLATSAHPVMRDRSSAYAQLSLRLTMLNLDGKTQGREIGKRILCTDCHSSDDSREVGGKGPSGPHGSVYPHILERRYEMSQVAIGQNAGPGTAIQNLFPSPSLDPSCASNPCASPYAMCAKCHDLTELTKNTSFTGHALHIQAGFSCSVCHTSHGISGHSAGISGERLVNFDANVVGSYQGTPISYNRATGSCNLLCHNHVHSQGAAVKSALSVTK